MDIAQVLFQLSCFLFNKIICFKLLLIYKQLKTIFFLYLGFGNISPRTEGGKIFCIIYALLGIPLFGFLLAGVGDQLGTIFGKGIAKVEDTFIVSIIAF